MVSLLTLSFFWTSTQDADYPLGLFTPMFQMYGRKPENWVHPQPEKAKEAAERVAAAAKEIAASKTKST
jgi:hypothetical protein